MMYGTRNSQDFRFIRVLALKAISHDHHLIAPLCTDRHGQFALLQSSLSRPLSTAEAL